MLYHINEKIFICLIITFTTVGSERPKYREDYVYEKAFFTFYKVHLESMEWPKARSRCEAEGAELMVPTSLDEADSVPLLTGHISNSNPGVFVGIHDLYSERTFVTINGSSVGNTFLELLWENKEPRPNAGRCGAMRRTGKLYLQPCNKQLPFICKKKASKIVYYKKCNTYDAKWQPGLNGKCYMVHSEPQTWFDAFSTCFAAGGNLAVLKNRAEADYIRDLFKSIKEQRVPDNDFAFLGFTDLLQWLHYRTIHGERLDTVGYASWDLQCDQSNSVNDTEGKHCGGVRRSGLLSTFNCNTPSVFFCEKMIANITDKNSTVNQSNNTHTYDNKTTKNDNKKKTENSDVKKDEKDGEQKTENNDEKKNNTDSQNKTEKIDEKKNENDGQNKTEMIDKNDNENKEKTR